MKKLLTLCVLSFIAFAAICQDNNLAKNSNTNTLLAKKTAKEYVMMKNGLALHVKFGDTTTLSSPLKLNNGELVMPDGTIQMSDGTTKKLKEGEYIDIDGQMGNAKK
jgi:hypothetical protein